MDTPKESDLFKRTKIVCTLGPATDQDGLLKTMIEAGMNVARLNLSHGTLDGHLQRLNEIRRLSLELDCFVAVMIDTRGPDIRIGELNPASIELKTGGDFTLTANEIVGGAGIASVSYRDLPKILKPGDAVFLNDGLIELRVISTDGTEVKCKIVAGGSLSSRKGVNIPGKIIPLPILTPNDISDLKVLIESGIDYVATSFIRTPDDIAQIRKTIGDKTPIIAKIETGSAVDNLDGIVRASDGCMVARGDLGIEIPPENVPGVQKRIIRTARRMCKPVVTATEMLESMTRNPRPTRAEVADVANAVLDGTSGVMLSQESAVGMYPVEAVKAMARICLAAENDLPFEQPEDSLDEQPLSLRDGIAQAAYLLAHDIKATAIICVTDSGRTAEHFSRLRPHQPILACTPEIGVARKLTMFWGVLPIVVAREESVETLLAKAMEMGKSRRLVAPGDRVVFTGNLSGRGGETNLLATVEVH